MNTTITKERKLEMCYGLWFHLVALKAERKDPSPETWRIEAMKENILYDFHRLDKAGVTFKVQNTVIAGAEAGKSFDYEVKKEIENLI